MQNLVAGGRDTKVALIVTCIVISAVVLAFFIQQWCMVYQFTNPPFNMTIRTVWLEWLKVVGAVLGGGILVGGLTYLLCALILPRDDKRC